MNRIVACKARRLQVPLAAVPYTTHVGYTHALITLAECMRSKIRGTGEPLHDSEHEIRFRLHGMVAHVRGRDECGLCSVRTSDNERVVLDLLPDYLRTAHAHGKDSYAALGAHLPAVSDASDGEEGGRLGLLDAWVLLLQGESSPRRHGARDSAVPLHAV